MATCGLKTRWHKKKWCLVYIPKHHFKTGSSSIRRIPEHTRYIYLVCQPIFWLFCDLLAYVGVMKNRARKTLWIGIYTYPHRLLALVRNFGLTLSPPNLSVCSTHLPNRPFSLVPAIPLQSPPARESFSELLACRLRSCLEAHRLLRILFGAEFSPPPLPRTRLTLAALR